MPRGPSKKMSKKASKKVTKISRKKYTPSSVRGVASNPQNYQIINSFTKPYLYKFKDTFQMNDIVGTGSGVVGLNTFQIKQIARYTALTSMFRRYRIDKIVFRFRLDNVELTDNAKIPTMYLRYNYDPDLVLGALSEDVMLRQQNVVAKQFHHNTINGSTLTYAIKPAVLIGTQLFNSTNFVPSPVFNRWCDFDPAGTVDEINHYGLQYVITNLPAGININADCEIQYTCKDVI